MEIWEELCETTTAQLRTVPVRLCLCVCVNLCVRQPSDIGMTDSRLNKHPQMKNCVRGTRLMSDTARTINLKNMV